MGFIDLLDPGYIQKARVKYQHPIPKRPQHSPYQAAPVKYGAKIQHPVPEDMSPPLTEEQIRRVQDVVGTFVWYGAACDPTLAASLSALATQQSKGTDNVKKASHQLLDYLVTHPNAAIRYHASDMILALDTDASYLSEPNARSHAAAYYFLTCKDRPYFNNGAIDILSTVIKHVMSSASEAKTGALYYGCNRAIPYRVTLEEMGHAQPGPMPVTTDNNIAHGLTMGTMNSKDSKSNDMRFQWLRCREAQRHSRARLSWPPTLMT